MKTIYNTTGTCAKAIAIDVDEQTHVINSVEFMGGCSGNTQGIAALIQGQRMEEVIQRLQGIRCGMKRTSCPDQLATALKEILSE
ncbi:MAG: TIGR03905 family TSCPD domain-containing protein [Prevotellaceae bacterium]|nr:TIGR03905 family TSCPD domain-containing protein [Prevotellaceae bacterium]